MIQDFISSSIVHSETEELFINLFTEAFGPEKSKYILTQYSFVDIYGNYRYIDFVLQSQDEKIAIEVDGETYHNPNNISQNKYFDDLLKQNSLVYKDWKIYRWVYSQLKNQPEKVKDQMLTFFGELPNFKIPDDYLPKQRGKIIELKEHQAEALENLEKMRAAGETIALLHHATGGRVIIVTGCINALISRVSELL